MPVKGGDQSPNAGAALGAALIAQLAVARVLVTADETHAYLLGHALDAGCLFKARLGVPCPACGATRGFAMALHGDLAHAWRLFPAAPLTVVGMAAFASALLAVSAVAWSRGRSPSRGTARVVRAAALAYGAATLLVFGGSWALELRSALVR